MKETMTVHKALAELKILNDRITDSIEHATFVVANKHSNAKIGGESVNEFSAGAKDKYKSILTLINRRNAIKRAVIKSNAVTEVTVNGKVYTVAEAIDMKSAGLSYQRMLVNSISSQLHQAQTLCDRQNGERLEQRVDEYVKSMYSGTDLKNMSEEIKRVRDDFIVAQTTEIVDPINAAKEIERMSNDNDAFMGEVDAALSVSNALTTIDVEYETM